MNSLDNPAPAGSIVAIYATGIGLNGGPVPVDGAIAPDMEPGGMRPVTIGYYGGFSTLIRTLDPIYAGQAPGLVTGAAQINFRLPVPDRTDQIAQVFDIAVDNESGGMPRSEFFTIFVGPPTVAPPAAP